MIKFNKKKKILICLAIVIVSFSFFAKNIHAQCVPYPCVNPPDDTGVNLVHFNDDGILVDQNNEPVGTLGSPSKPTESSYKLLAPLPGIDTFESDPAKNKCAFGDYLNKIIKIIIGIAGVLAMVMIVMGGITYMTSELVSSKEAGKQQITHAILGLLLALGAWLILNTINPNLLKLCLDNMPTATIKIGPGLEADAPFVDAPVADLSISGIYCPKSKTTDPAEIKRIAMSFVGHVTYSQASDKRNKYDASVPTWYEDCSSFIKQVYTCAGLTLNGDNTGAMFAGGQSESFTGSSSSLRGMKVGDLVGWSKGESTKYPNDGHIMMYIGDGEFIDTHGGAGVNKAVGPLWPFSQYQKEFKHIIHLPN